MESRQGRLYFGAERECHLSIHIDVQGHRHLALFHGKQPIPAGGPPLALLQYFLEHPEQILFKLDLQEALGLKEFDKTLSLLKGSLDELPMTRAVIESCGGRGGFRFNSPVHREGDTGVEAYPRWRGPIFDELLRETERLGDVENQTSKKSGKDICEIRIATIAFSCGIPELGLAQIMRRGVRIHIIMANPDNDALLKARHMLRQDDLSPSAGRDEIRRQIKAIKSVVDSVPESAKPNLRLKLSNAMPSAFIAHTQRKAVAGLFLGHTSYSDGPMIVALAGTETWHQLKSDWKARWRDDDATEEKLYTPRNAAV